MILFFPVRILTAMLRQTKGWAQPILDPSDLELKFADTLVAVSSVTLVDSANSVYTMYFYSPDVSNATGNGTSVVVSIYHRGMDALQKVEFPFEVFAVNSPELSKLVPNSVGPGASWLLAGSSF